MTQNFREYAIATYQQALDAEVKKLTQAALAREKAFKDAIEVCRKSFADLFGADALEFLEGQGKWGGLDRPSLQVFECAITLRLDGRWVVYFPDDNDASRDLITRDDIALFVGAQLIDEGEYA